jgi:hypothetical protein
MKLDRDKANEARVAAALLALGIQRKNMISTEDFGQVSGYATDILNKMGVYVDIDALNGIDQIPSDDAVVVVNRVKTKLVNGIGSSCDSTTAALFELTFDFYLVVTTPEIIPVVEPALIRIASAAGFRHGAISAILAKAKIDTDSAIADFESAADEALGASTTGSSSTWLDAIEIKPGIGGVNFDVKKAFSLIAKWIEERRSR